MKIRLTILGLLFSVLSYGQIIGIIGSSGGNVSYTSQLDALINVWTVDPHDDTLAIIDNFFQELIDSSYMDRIDLMGTVLNNRANSLIDLVNPDSTFTEEGTGELTFVAYNYFEGDTVNIINTNRNLSSEMDNFSLDDGSLFVYILDNEASDGSQIGVDAGTALETRITARALSDQSYHKINASTSQLTSSLNSSGLWFASRISSSSQILNRNGALFSTSTTTSESIPDGEVYVFSRSDDQVVTGGRIALWGVIDGLTASEMIGLNSIIEDFADDMGWGIQ